MTLVPASAIQKIPDWMPDVAGLNTEAANDIRNLISRGDRYIPAKASTPLSSALSDRVYGAVSAQDLSGAVLNFAATASGLFLQSGLDWNDVSGAAYTTSVDGRIKFTVYGNQVISSNYAEPLQVYTIGSSVKFEELVDIQAKDLAVVANFLMLINTVDPTDGPKPQRVRWSAIDNPADFTVSAQTQSDLQDLAGPGGPNQAIVANQNYAIVLQQRSIWRTDYVGSPVVFDFQEVEQNRGTRLPGSVVGDGVNVFYRGEDGFYMFNGVQSIPIGYSKIDQWFRDNLNSAFDYRITASVDPVNRVVKWSFPSNDSVDGTPDTILYFNYATNRWTYSRQSCDLIFRGLSAALTLEQLDVLYPGGLETIPVGLDNEIFAGGKIVDACFDTTHSLASFSGAALEGYIELGDQQPFDGQRSYLTEIIPVTDGDATVNIKYRDRLNDDYAETGDTATSDTTGAAPFNLDARYMNPTFTIQNHSYFSGYRARIVPSGAA